ncbi:MAG: hypothetical protein K5945_01775, partial [Bacteroidaceae bacterium]|nr:hypothetical protein [Bacteroidaceae bacterium]
KSEDPVASLFEQFMMLTAGERKQKPEMPAEYSGRMLFDNGSSLKVWHDTAHDEVCILARLECSPQIERQLLQLQGDMGRTIGRYRNEIVKPVK